MTIPHLSPDDRRIMFGPEPMKAGQEMVFVFVPSKGKAWESSALTVAGDLDLLGLRIGNKDQLSMDTVPAEVFEHGLQVNFPAAHVGEYITLRVKARDVDTVFVGVIAGRVLHE